MIDITHRTPRMPLALCLASMLACGAFDASAAAGDECPSHWDNSIPGVPEFDQIRAATVYNGDLIVGGIFTTIGGESANYIARWDGSQWHPLGDGVNAQVRSFTEYNGDLIVGGHFTTAGGVSATGIARWDGSSWHALGEGLSGGCCPRALALAVYEGDLYAGGPFWNAGGVPNTMFIARWDGSQWHSLGDQETTHGMRDMVVYNGELIVAGDFNTITGVPANRIARWNGSTFQPLGSGVSMGDAHSYVETVTVHDGKLIAAGQFITAGGAPASHIASWDGTSWQPLDSGVSGGCCGEVWAVTEFGGDLIAAGPFTIAGGNTVNGIARWDGAQWHALGDACPGSVDDGCGLNVWIMAATEYEGELVLGGAFTIAFGLPAAAIATWSGCLAECPPADLNCDGVVDVSDLLILLGQWGSCPDPDDCPADLNGDGSVDVSDLLILLANWG